MVELNALLRSHLEFIDGKDKATEGNMSNNVRGGPINYEDGTSQQWRRCSSSCGWWDNIVSRKSWLWPLLPGERRFIPMITVSSYVRMQWGQTQWQCSGHRWEFLSWTLSWETKESKVVLHWLLEVCVSSASNPYLREFFALQLFLMNGQTIWNNQYSLVGITCCIGFSILTFLWIFLLVERTKTMCTNFYI